nr:reverse transcriptase domain-containing protein [Tanacetum cinerariifolium]
KEVTAVIEEEGPTWMTELVNYLKEGTLLADEKEARKIRLKARQYELMEGILYKRSFLTPWLRCVGPLQAVIPAEIGMPTYRTTTVDVVNNDKELRLNLDLLEERRELAAINEARKQWTGTTDQLIEDLEAAYDNASSMFSIRIHHDGKFQRYPSRMYVSGRVDIFDMVDIDLFIVVALNMMVLKLGYTGGCSFLATFVQSFKLIEVYIEYGVTGLDSYFRAPRFRATLEEITDDPSSIVANRTEKIIVVDLA